MSGGILNLPRPGLRTSARAAPGNALKTQKGACRRRPDDDAGEMRAIPPGLVRLRLAMLDARLSQSPFEAQRRQA
jgi:hypothetical protein